MTAEEVRYVAQELETTIGSIYSILSQEFQLPLVRRCLVQMEKLGLVPEFPQGSKGIEPVITTGTEALGRGADLQNLDTFIRYAQVVPQLFQQAVKGEQLLSAVCSSLRLDYSKLLKSSDEMMKEQQQQAALAAAQQGIGTAIGNASQPQQK